MASISAAEISNGGLTEDCIYVLVFQKIDPHEWEDDQWTLI